MLDRFCRTVFLFFAACFLIASGRAASFTASLDRDTIMLGEQATLTLRFDGDAPQNPPRLSEIPGLKSGYVGRQSMDLNINGVASSIVTFTYAVMPTKTGGFTTPLARPEAGGKSASATPLKLTVSKVNAPSAAAVNSGSEVAFLKFTFPKNKIYVGEPAVGQIDLYRSEDTPSIEIK